MTETTDIYNKLLENGIDVPLSEIEKAYSTLIGLGVSEKDASNTVIRNIAKKHGVTINYSNSSSASQFVNVEEALALAVGKWCSLKINVVSITQEGEKFAQRGVIGDETGTISFISSLNTSFRLEPGKSYSLKSVVINDFNGQNQISMNKTTQATPLAEVIEAREYVKIIEGKVVAIQPGSGLIKRCPECNRALRKGACMKHGKVDGTYDLRIKAILDDGEETYNILFQKDMTERIAGFNQETAIAMAADALDQEVVADQINKLMCNRYYRVHTSQIGIVKDIESLAGPLTNPLEANVLL